MPFPTLRSRHATAPVFQCMAVKTELEKPYRLCLGYRAVADDTAWKKSASVQESQWQHAFVSPTEATAEKPNPRHTGERITLNLVQVDLKDFFRLLH